MAALLSNLKAAVTGQMRNIKEQVLTLGRIGLDEPTGGEQIGELCCRRGCVVFFNGIMKIDWHDYITMAC